MKHRTARFTSSLLAVYLLLVTVGLPLEQVYCACVGQVRVQVLGMATELDSCAHGTQDAEPLFACCAKMLAEREAANAAATVSCHFGEVPLTGNAQANSVNCMTLEVVYVHFNADFVVMNAFTDEGASLPSPAVLVSTLFLSDAAAVAATHPICDPPPPVRASGWEIRIFHQSFLC